MIRKYFGTDGIRGEYGASILTDEFAFKLGCAMGRWLSDKDAVGMIVMGRDTRASGLALRDSLAAGFQAVADFKIVDLGVVPTPAVAVYVRGSDASLGVVITASHNPAKDNGIKFFDTNGLKFSDETEVEFEALLDEVNDSGRGELGPIENFSDGSAEYLKLLRPLLPENCLKGMKIVVDTANGATCFTTPGLLRELGADLVMIGDSPDGMNINDGVGSQHAELLAKTVLREKAVLGIAHDGDGDRVLFCDENGKLVDGDVLLGILGLHELRKDQLVDKTLVATKQSNLGLDRAIKEAGGTLVRTDIGDRYVLEEMLRYGFSLGGENSGHIIWAKLNPTGDGLLSAIQLLSIMIESQSPLSDLQSVIDLFPQKTGAIAVHSKPVLEDIPEIQFTLRSLEREMGESGRVLLRYSGTEPKIRLLVEGENSSLVDRWYQTLESKVRTQLL